MVVMRYPSGVRIANSLTRNSYGVPRLPSWADRYPGRSENVCGIRPHGNDTDALHSRHAHVNNQGDGTLFGREETSATTLIAIPMSALEIRDCYARNSSDGFKSTAGITNSVVRLYRRGDGYRRHSEVKTHRATGAVNLIAPSSVNVRRSQGQIRLVAALPDCSLRSPASAPEVVRISR